MKKLTLWDGDWGTGEDDTDLYAQPLIRYPENCAAISTLSFHIFPYTACVFFY